MIIYTRYADSKEGIMSGYVITITKDWLQSDMWIDLSPHARCIYLAILSEYDGESTRLEYKDIARLAGVGASTVAHNIQILIKWGFIDRIGKCRYVPIVNTTVTHTHVSPNLI